MGGKAGVEVLRWTDDAHAVGTDDTQTSRFGFLLYFRLELSALVTGFSAAG